MKITYSIAALASILLFSTSLAGAYFPLVFCGHFFLILSLSYVLQQAKPTRNGARQALNSLGFDFLSVILLFLLLAYLGIAPAYLREGTEAEKIGRVVACYYAWIISVSGLRWSSSRPKAKSKLNRSYWTACSVILAVFVIELFIY